jgi:DNA-binding transcriptional MocR family regulator
MTIKAWSILIRQLPPRLSLKEAHRYIGESYDSTRRMLRRFRYRYRDARHTMQLATRRFNPDKADWSKSNAALARQWGVTKQRVHFVRRQLGKPFVDCRGRPPNKSRARRA